MRVTLSVLQWIVFVGLLVSNWWWLALPLVAWLIFSQNLLLPLLIAVLVDGYFNAWSSLPYLSLTVFGVGLFVVLLRPYVHTNTV